ncbi:DUF2064 domain-containing protein [Antribacter gilvus]|uniref:DUF2064 domain-containing protein n=1 Tax=Antribacter gilvus TaxID=2304675 RepID=UPI000F7B1709|nr:DUF2064 domain-containing protein [Antribacter gilvus]
MPDRALVDVILPCLDEADGLAWLLPRLPPGMRAVVVDNGSTDGSPEVAAAHGALVVREARRGYGAACAAGLEAATADVVAFCDADATLDPLDLPLVTGPVVSGEADLVLGRRRPEPGAWPWHLRLANVELARRVRRRTGLKIRDLGPMRAGRREALLGLGLRDRRSGYPLETLVAAADRGWLVAEVDVPYYRRQGRSKVTGTPLGAWRAVRDMSTVLAAPRALPKPGVIGHEGPVEPARTVLVLAKEPMPGRVKTRLVGALTADEAADLARAALTDTLDAVAEAAPERRVLVLDGSAGPWLPEGFAVLPQVPGGLDRRIAAAFDDALGSGGFPGPAVLVGMDTPQLGPALRAIDFAGHDAVLGRTPDGGYWCVGLRTPDATLFHGVPMSTPGTGDAQLARLHDAGLRVRILPPLRDVDTVEDAADVAALVPGSRFAEAWAQVAGRERARLLPGASQRPESDLEAVSRAHRPPVRRPGGRA